MATLEISRLAKLLVDAQGISLMEAEAKLSSLRLDIIANNPETVSAQCALLTAVAVGIKTFVGGVRVRIQSDPPLSVKLPIKARDLSEAVGIIGATDFDGEPSARIVIGDSAEQDSPTAHTFWEGWTGGASDRPRKCGNGDNPLTGITAGAAAVARCFGRMQGHDMAESTDVDLWPSDGSRTVPGFAETYFPRAVWLLGLGNLGQAFLWSLSALPFSSPIDVLLLLQDRDRIKPENWGTSILVTPDDYGSYKTAIGERWARARGFDVRRCDRWLAHSQRTVEGEPALAFCGFDNVDARLFLDHAGFDIIIDSGLGRDRNNYDRFRTTILDSEYRASDHFSVQDQRLERPNIDYQALVETDACGAAVFEGISIAAPYVSALAGAVAVSRLIAICSGAPVPRNETRWLRDSDSRGARWAMPRSRRILRGR